MRCSEAVDLGSRLSGRARCRCEKAASEKGRLLNTGNPFTQKYRSITLFCRNENEVESFKCLVFLKLVL